MNSVSEEPLVSVWMNTYNHGKFIRQSIETVLMQKTNFDFEIVIGEDYSTDNTREIIREFEMKYPHIVKPIYHTTNVGALRNAFEFCYPKLRGKYVACLDGDDYWTDENKLQQQVDLLENDDKAVICFTQVQVFDENTQQVTEHWSQKFNQKKRYKLEDILHTFNIVACSMMYKNIYPVFPYRLTDFPTGDVSLYAFLLLKGDAVLLNKVTAIYRQHEGGMYSPHSEERKNLTFLEIFKAFLKYQEFRKQFPLLQKLLSDRAYRALCFEIKKKAPDKKIVRQYYRVALKNMHLQNLYFPVKTILRRALFDLTGKSLGRKL
jgi:glycosyltransferase involved in cell wall biosynthesis